jgi:mono/diheme cytochrome c family protein
LVKRLIGNGEETRMPMGADPLPASQIKLIRAWIDQNSFAVAEDAVPAQIAPVAAHTSQDSPGIFASRIRPILAARCYSCHGPDLQQNGLRLDSLAAVLKGSDNGRVIVPGDSQRSPLVRRLLAIALGCLMARHRSVRRPWISSASGSTRARQGRIRRS